MDDIEVVVVASSSNSNNNNNNNANNAPSSPPSTPGSSRLSRISLKPKSPAPKKKNPRWEGQTNVPVFELLPDELVIRIHSYLDATNLGVTAQSCKRLNDVCYPLFI